MGVPNYIRRKMHNVVKHSLAAANEMKIIEEWLERQGFDVDLLRDGCGVSLDELEYGNDITDELCKRIERNGDIEGL